jgi:hypothetical protein
MKSILCLREWRNLLIPKSVNFERLDNRYRNHILRSFSFSHDADIYSYDRSPEEATKRLEKQLKGRTISVIPEFPEWNEKLASNSEANVKADRAPAKPIEELKRQTVELLQAFDQQQQQQQQEKEENIMESHKSRDFHQ